jgi:hypothetical protein
MELAGHRTLVERSAANPMHKAHKNADFAAPYAYPS